MINLKINILNVPIDAVTQAEALARLSGFLEEDRYHILCTPNPEIIMAANSNHELMEVLQNADLVVPDGIGVVLASRLLKKETVKIKERVPGIDLIYALFAQIQDTGHTVYLLGGKPGVVDAAKRRMEEKFPGLRIIGCHHGYFNIKEEKEIIKEIQSLKPDVLLCGLGFPKQELWVYRHRKRLPVKIAAGVGGSLDVMADTVKRAPVLFQKLGLEWFYRLLQQPARFVRMLQLPLFVLEVIRNQKGNKKNEGK